MDEETRRIHRLLSDGKLSGPEAEEILEHVLAAGRRKKAPPVRAIRYFAGAALAAAAAVLLVVYLPRDPGGQVRDPEMGDMAPPVLSVTCSPGELSACPTSSKLVFSVSDPRASGFLSAYADLRDHDPMRIFLYSKEDGSPELPAPADATHGSEHAVRLAGLLKPGRYRVHAILADRALGREEMVGAAAAPKGGPEIRAVARVEVVVTE